MYGFPRAGTKVNVNDIYSGKLKLVKDIDIDIKDGVLPVVPDSVSIVGNTVSIQITVGGGTLSTAKIMKTGQLIENEPGEAITRGRLIDFWTLSENNIFGHAFRFCGTTGGYSDGVSYFDIFGAATTYALAFPNNLICEMSTYDGAVFLIYYIGDSLPFRSRTIQLSVYLLSTFGGLTGWNLWNWLEIANVVNPSLSPYIMNYPPFNFDATIRYVHTATSNGTTAARTDLASLAYLGTTTFANALQGVWVRYTTPTEIGF